MGTEEITIEIKVDGRNIPLNRFVQKIVSKVVVGMVDSLRDVDDWKGATVTVKKRSN